MADSTEDYARARLRFRAMTLRGVGPYIEGSRIEIRPLTVLCGTNGSGKSTWLRVLDLLRRNTHHLPWSFSGSEEDASAISFTNAFYHLMPDTETYESDHEVDAFGVPGTVGLEFDVAESFSLADPCGGSSSDGALRSGRCNKGDHLRLRFGDPSPASRDEYYRRLRSHAELSWNGCRVSFDRALPFSQRNPLSPSARDFLSEATSQDVISAPYNLYCSPAFFTSRADAVDPIKLATFHREEIISVDKLWTNEIDNAEAVTLIELAALRMRQLAEALLADYRHIGAIRQVGDKQDADSSDPGIKNRDVGINGASAWNCERAFANSGMQLPTSVHLATRRTTGLRPNAPLFLEGFVSNWMKRLTGAGLAPSFGANRDGLPADAWRDLPPVGFLRSAAPPEGSNYLAVTGPLLSVVEHPCFGLEPQYPKQMSSGFHQIFPIIVQSGIMGEFETVAVENPEVHLHPKLQLDLAEFFLHQARSGKQFIIETHSDLFVRRVLREILSEEIGIGQENVRIYFSRLEPAHKGFSGAVLEDIRIKDNRVENWPPGFMDEAVKEDRRLLDTLYPSNIDDAESDGGSAQDPT